MTTINVFSGLTVYGNSYEVVERRNFTREEAGVISKAVVVPSEFGKSVCFMMKSGGKTYIPVSRDSVCNTGDTVDLMTAKLLILERDGKDRINRVEIK